MENNTLQDSIKQTFAIEGLLMAIPSLPSFYPQLISLLEMLEKQIDEHLGNNEKMLVLTKKNGITFLLTLDTSKNFTIDNKIVFNGDESAVISTYEKNEWKEKLLSSSALLTLKDRYDKMDKTEIDNNPLASILKNM